MTKQEFDEMAALVVRLRKELEHTNQHLVAHIDALTKSNAQCGEYLRHNEMLAADRATLHRELVDARAALASVTEQRDSLRRTLDEWERADTKPHERIEPPLRMGLVSAGGPVYIHDDVADHVVPPVLDMCMTCHECGGALRPSPAAGSHRVLYCRTERCSRKNTAWRDELSPYHGPCKSATPVRHE